MPGRPGDLQLTISRYDEALLTGTIAEQQVTGHPG
jgi:hypothetical protein